MGNGGNRFDRLREPRVLMQEELLMQVPSDPQKSEIIEILSKNPTVISYIQNLMNEIDNAISMKKIILNKKKQEYEEKMSQARMDTITRYRKKLLNHLKNEPNEVRKLMEELGITKSDAKEIVRLQRPDKPTATDLKDTSLIKTKVFYDEEVVPLEKEIVNLQKDYDDWKVKHNLFENNFKASQSIKGLIQNELRH